MGRVSDMHINTAMDRADTAENEAEFLKSIMRLAATDCLEIVVILGEFANPNNIITTDLMTRLNRIADGLSKGAGEPGLPPEGEIIDVEECEF